MSTAQMLRMQVLEMALRTPGVNCPRQALRVAAEFQAHIDGVPTVDGAGTDPYQAAYDKFRAAVKAVSDNLSASAKTSAATAAVLSGIANASGNVPRDLLRGDIVGTASTLGRSHGSASDTDFGFALKWLKAGKKVARAGWNGKGMFVYLVPAASYPVQTGAAKSHFGEGSLVPYNAYLALKGVDDTVSTWAPSVGDALADDWQLVE